MYVRPVLNHIYINEPPAQVSRRGLLVGLAIGVQSLASGCATGRSLLNVAVVPLYLDHYRNFLRDNPRVAVAMVWNGDRVDSSQQLLQMLFEEIAKIEAGQITSAPPVPRNLESLRNDTRGAIKLAYSRAEAQRIYIRSVANSLYVEVNRLIPWSIRNYSEEQLSQLFNSNNLFESPWASSNYYFANDGHITDWNRPLYFRELSARGFIRATPSETLFALTDWMRRTFVHQDISETTFAFAERTYGFPGYPSPEMFFSERGLYPIYGCHGITVCYQSLLQALNIPVQYRLHGGGHGYGVFPTLGLVLGDGDLVLLAHSSQMPSREIFFSMADFEMDIRPLSDAAVMDACRSEFHRRQLRFPDNDMAFYRALEILARADRRLIRYPDRSTEHYYRRLGIVGREETALEVFFSRLCSVRISPEELATARAVEDRYLNRHGGNIVEAARTYIVEWFAAGAQREHMIVGE